MLERTKGEGVRRRPTVQGLRRRGAAERRKWSGSFENGPQFFKRARAFVRTDLSRYGVLCSGKSGTPRLSLVIMSPRWKCRIGVTWLGRDEKSRGLERAWRGNRCWWVLSQFILCCLLHLNERSQCNDMMEGPFDTIYSSLPRPLSTGRNRKIAQSPHRQRRHKHASLDGPPAFVHNTTVRWSARYRQHKKNDLDKLSPKEAHRALA
jgi:hypothetical protein